MKFLFDNTTNIDLEIKSFSGHFPLYTSMLNENIDAMDLLLKKDADINSKQDLRYVIANTLQTLDCKGCFYSAVTDNIP